MDVPEYIVAAVPLIRHSCSVTSSVSSKRSKLYDINDGEKQPLFYSSLDNRRLGGEM